MAKFLRYFCLLTVCVVLDQAVVTTHGFGRGILISLCFGAMYMLGAYDAEVE